MHTVITFGDNVTMEWLLKLLVSLVCFALGDASLNAALSCWESNSSSSGVGPEPTDVRDGTPPPIERGGLLATPVADTTPQK
jgi:hypothetical protein